MMCHLRRYLPLPLPRHQHCRRLNLSTMRWRWGYICWHWMIAVDIDASVWTNEVIVDIGFNCIASSISTSSSSSVSVSKYNVSVEWVISSCRWLNRKWVFFWKKQILLRRPGLVISMHGFEGIRNRRGKPRCSSDYRRSPVVPSVDTLRSIKKVPSWVALWW